jgi:hypothetical protein
LWKTCKQCFFSVKLFFHKKKFALKKIHELEKNKILTLVGILSSYHNDFEKNLTRVKLQVQLSQQTPNKIRDSKVGKTVNYNRHPKGARSLKTEHHHPREKRGENERQRSGLGGGGGARGV